MTNNPISQEQQISARVAGFTLAFGMAIVMFGYFYCTTALIVPGNVAETARNITAHETLFRINIACDLLYVVNVAVLLAALYVIFKPINRGLALAATFLRLVFVMMWGVAPLNMLGALKVVSDATYSSAFQTNQLHAFSSMILRSSFDAYYVGLPFFALASTICSYLWLTSGYIPRFLASYGVLASAWCVICASLYIVFPSFSTTVSLDWFDFPMAIFEMATGLWLLSKGLRLRVNA